MGYEKRDQLQGNEAGWSESTFCPSCHVTFVAVGRMNAGAERSRRYAGFRYNRIRAQHNADDSNLRILLVV